MAMAIPDLVLADGDIVCASQLRHLTRHLRFALFFFN